MSFCRVGREPQAFGLCDVPRVRGPATLDPRYRNGGVDDTIL